MVASSSGRSPSPRPTWPPPSLRVPSPNRGLRRRQHGVRAGHVHDAAVERGGHERHVRRLHARVGRLLLAGRGRQGLQRRRPVHLRGRQQRRGRRRWNHPVVRAADVRRSRRCERRREQLGGPRPVVSARGRRQAVRRRRHLHDLRRQQWRRPSPRVGGRMHGARFGLVGRLSFRIGLHLGVELRNRELELRRGLWGRRRPGRQLGLERVELGTERQRLQRLERGRFDRRGFRWQCLELWRKRERLGGIRRLARRGRCRGGRGSRPRRGRCSLAPGRPSGWFGWLRWPAPWPFCDGDAHAEAQHVFRRPGSERRLRAARPPDDGGGDRAGRVSLRDRRARADDRRQWRARGQGRRRVAQYPAGTSFEVPGKSGFDVRARQPAAYLCEFL